MCEAARRSKEIELEQSPFKYYPASTTKPVSIVYIKILNLVCTSNFDIMALDGVNRPIWKINATTFEKLRFFFQNGKWILDIFKTPFRIAKFWRNIQVLWNFEQNLSISSCASLCFTQQDQQLTVYVYTQPFLKHIVGLRGP